VGALSGVQHRLDIRPIRHRTEERVRAHVFLRMLSYYVSFHASPARTHALQGRRQTSRRGGRTSPVAPALRSTRAFEDRTKRTEQGAPVHSFTSLLKDLATIAANRVQPNDTDLPAFPVITTPTPLQRQAFELLGVSHRLGYVT
jgi:hypothetical protein